MIHYHVLGLADEISREIRRTLLAPDYGHPVVRELARGTGPCRACLDLFEVGKEDRLLFTYRPAGGEGTLGSPGPVFIHAEPCRQFRGAGFPSGLRSLPLLFEAWASGNRILSARRASGADIDAVLTESLADPRVDYLHVRHAEAGCHITRVNRGPAPVVMPLPLTG